MKRNRSQYEGKQVRPHTALQLANIEEARGHFLRRREGRPLQVWNLNGKAAPAKGAKGAEPEHV